MSGVEINWKNLTGNINNSQSGKMQENFSQFSHHSVTKT